ncbi:hypothetical protein [Sphingomonas soli]|uniref:hypothetical protein n=1 Tax=Sphingomonas soli TaxID=266127 RepID=UPI000832C6F2|nr:hypothetical protein [Sphingomonas soli]
MAKPGFLERQFRRQFTPHEGGYLLQSDHLYSFDADEVEQFIEEWRRHWANPWVWIGYFLIGIAVPVWFYSQDYWGAAFVIGVIAGIAMVVNLTFPLRQPYDVAAGRAPLPEAPVWRPPTGLGVIGGFGAAAAYGCYVWYMHEPGEPWLSGFEIPVLLWALIFLWFAFVQLVLWWRASGFSHKPFSREKAEELRGNGIYFALAVLAVCLWFSPNADWWERMLSIGVLVFFAVVDVVKRVRGREEADAA